MLYLHLIPAEFCVYMLFTPERLKYLVEVSQSGSFSAAARKLGVSAAAVSQSIQSLEISQSISESVT